MRLKVRCNHNFRLTPLEAHCANFAIKKYAFSKKFFLLKKRDEMSVFAKLFKKFNFETKRLIFLKRPP